MADSTFDENMDDDINGTLRSSNYPYSNATASYTTAFTLNSSGVISSVSSYSAGNPPSVGASDIVLGFLTVDVYQQEFINNTQNIVFSPVALSTSGGISDFVVDDYVDGVYLTSGVSNDLGFGTNSTVHDYYVYDLSNTPGYTQGDVQLVFWGTNAAASSKNYNQYRKIKIFKTKFRT